MVENYKDHGFIYWVSLYTSPLFLLSAGLVRWRIQIDRVGVVVIVVTTTDVGIYCYCYLANANQYIVPAFIVYLAIGLSEFYRLFLFSGFL